MPSPFWTTKSIGVFLCTTLLLCACAGKASYTDCGFAPDGSVQGGGAATAGGGTGVVCPETTEGMQPYCPHLSALLKSCGTTLTAASPSVINLLLVVDRSASMNDPHPSGNGLTKWETMVAALNATLNQLGVASTDPFSVLNVELELFPYNPVSSIAATATDPQLACQVPADSSAVLIQTARGGTRFSAIIDSLSAQIPTGRSPTAQALSSAYAYFTQGEGQCLTGYRMVLLVTNGGDNCFSSMPCAPTDPCAAVTGLSCQEAANCCATTDGTCLNDSAVVDAIQRLSSINVRTAVLGMPSTVADRASLNAYALAGGDSDANSTTGNNFYPVTDTSASRDLAALLSSLSAPAVRSCDIALAPTTLSAGLRVFVDCREIFPVDIDAGAAGYYLDTNQSPPHLKFLGSTCDWLTAHGAHQVDVVSPCSPTQN